MTAWQNISLFIVGFFLDLAWGKYMQATAARQPLAAAFYTVCISYIALFVQRLYNMESDVAIPYLAGLACGAAVAAWPASRQG